MPSISSTTVLSNLTRSQLAPPTNARRSRWTNSLTIMFLTKWGSTLLSTSTSEEEAQFQLAPPSAARPVPSPMAQSQRITMFQTSELITTSRLQTRTWRMPRPNSDLGTQCSRRRMKLSLKSEWDPPHLAPLSSATPSLTWSQRLTSCHTKFQSSHLRSSSLVRPNGEILWKSDKEYI